MFEALRHRRVLSIMPTYQCTAACRDCGTFSNPRPGQPWLDPAHIMRAIDEAANGGYVGVVFTGGEATLALDTVLEGIQKARRLGLGTRLVTNASWATTEEQAFDLMHALAGAGLDEINFSTGDEHIRFVSLENVIRAIAAALRNNLRSICVVLELTQQATVTQGDIVSHPLFEAATRDFPTHLVRIFQSPWMPMSATRTHRYPKAMLLSRENIATKPGCGSCLSTTTLQADGRIAACCGLGMRAIPELQLGHITSTTLADADADASNDFLKRWIRLEGPERILAWAAEKDSSIEWEYMYAHKCQACIRLYKDAKVRTVIRNHYEEKIADIVFGEFLLSHYDHRRSDDEFTFE
jgi:Radical SAM superfamily